MVAINAAGKAMFKLQVEDTQCRACRGCPASEVCRGNAFIRFDKTDSPFIDMSRCWGCMLCVPACPFGAVTRSDYSK